MKCNLVAPCDRLPYELTHLPRRVQPRQQRRAVSLERCVVQVELRSREPPPLAARCPDLVRIRVEDEVKVRVRVSWRP